MKLLRMRAQCVRCILNVRLNEIYWGLGDGDEAYDAAVELLARAADAFARSREVTEVSSELYRFAISRAPMATRRYEELSAESLRRALEEVRALEDLLGQGMGYDEFRDLAKLSVLGNLLDLGVQGHAPPSSVATLLRTAEFAVDDTRIAYELLESGRGTVLWLFDNAGEAAYDVPLIRFLRRMGWRVVGVAKERPGFQNDLTVELARGFGVDRELDALLPIAGGHSTLHPEAVGEELRRELESAGLVVAKGMAHYEYLSEVDVGRPVLFLLVAKCEPVAASLGVRKGDLVALLRRARA
ncbi:MAG: ARMT1-like domain-containing protein [Desulfurococcaceae archaeon]